MSASAEQAEEKGKHWACVCCSIVAQLLAAGLRCLLEQWGLRRLAGAPSEHWLCTSACCVAAPRYNSA